MFASTRSRTRARATPSPSRGSSTTTTTPERSPRRRTAATDDAEAHTTTPALKKTSVSASIVLLSTETIVTRVGRLMSSAPSTMHAPRELATIAQSPGFPFANATSQTSDERAVSAGHVGVPCRMSRDQIRQRVAFRARVLNHDPWPRNAAQTQAAPALLCVGVVTTAKAARKPRRNRFLVSIVSANPETRDGLQTYLVDAGISSQSVNLLSDAELVAPEGVRAAVIFPDDFDLGEVATLVRKLRRASPPLLSILVTREPSRVASATAPNGEARVVILPRPSFGWDILDAIRAHASAER